MAIAASSMTLTALFEIKNCRQGYPSLVTARWPIADGLGDNGLDYACVSARVTTCVPSKDFGSPLKHARELFDLPRYFVIARSAASLHHW